MRKAFETYHGKGDDLSLHRHTFAYVALVLEGAYEERSVDGRFRLDPGTLVYHPPFHAHMNVFLSDEIRVLNVEIGDSNEGLEGYCAASTSDLGAFERLMRGQPNKTFGAAEEIFRMHRNQAESPPRWVAILARALAMESDPRPIKTMARRLGVTPEHASRKFKKEFGVGPLRFRRERRLRRVIDALAGEMALASIAAEAGFADQSHMGRAIKAALGETPGALRLRARESDRAPEEIRNLGSISF